MSAWNRPLGGVRPKAATRRPCLQPRGSQAVEYGVPQTAEDWRADAEVCICSVWRVVGATVASVMVTVAHVMVEGVWFSPLLDVFPEPDGWFSRQYAYSLASPWHIGWILGLSWVVTWLLTGEQRAVAFARALGVLTAAVAAVFLAVEAVESVAIPPWEGTGPAGNGLYAAPAGRVLFLLLAVVCVAGFVVGRTLTARALRRGWQSAAPVAVWLVAGGLLAALIAAAPERRVGPGYAIWPAWSVASGVLSAARCQRAHTASD